MVTAMLQYIWPKDDKAIRDRVKVAVSLLIGAKVLNVTVPFIFKYAVDYLNAAGHLNVDSAAETVTTVATAILLGCKNVCLNNFVFGILRINYCRWNSSCWSSRIQRTA